MRAFYSSTPDFFLSFFTGGKKEGHASETWRGDTRALTPGDIGYRWEREVESEQREKKMLEREREREREREKEREMKKGIKRDDGRQTYKTKEQKRRGGEGRGEKEIE